MKQIVHVWEIKRRMIVFLIVLFAGVGFAVFADDTSTSGKNLFNDYDQDGLSNDEEIQLGTDPYKSDTDGDNYSDYAEISTGYDPLKPAPGDKLVQETSKEETVQKSNSVQKTAIGASSESEVSIGASGSDMVADENTNLTEEVSKRFQTLLSNAAKSNAQDGSGDMSDMGMEEAIGGIIGDIVTENTIDIEVPEIDMSNIKVKKQKYGNMSEEDKKVAIQKDTEEYLTAVAYVLAANSPEKITSQQDAAVVGEGIADKSIQSFTSGNYGYFEEVVSRAESVFEQLKDIEVPENMLETHEQGMQLAQYAIEMKKVLKMSNDDPVRDIINLSQAQGFIQSLQYYSANIYSNLKDAGITSGTSLKL